MLSGGPTGKRHREEEGRGRSGVGREEGGRRRKGIGRNRVMREGRKKGNNWGKGRNREGDAIEMKWVRE